MTAMVGGGDPVPEEVLCSLPPQLSWARPRTTREKRKVPIFVLMARVYPEPYASSKRESPTKWENSWGKPQ